MFSSIAALRPCEITSIQYLGIEYYRRQQKCDSVYQLAIDRPKRRYFNVSPKPCLQPAL
ncbi:DEHA2C07700p [Debaryomyces hansenii CBS767]|uniref:DEHA2C07700p n=1 Tax=Debaryomyces hansenii (strain ATCC 36239 / CBS 767 / BCRC 21394 / JCM 1990 / NBRC 0083 / IGC 2968) TaxID=284592 RepID=B5RT87_DEBHA|nr:DEHA2C07700p [Debaryomyces hansenii CBS767]CAR65549.1 DEHA2C07700p [Debaryomyces hansenii CBS767]|eukprot:XP_002770184.1 DEHA2C07700p [Debaryomyces hansenii CBS767]